MKTVGYSIINNSCRPFHISLLIVSSRMRDARDLHDDGGWLPITQVAPKGLILGPCLPDGMRQ